MILKGWLGWIAFHTERPSNADGSYTALSNGLPVMHQGTMPLHLTHPLAAITFIPHVFWRPHRLTVVNSVSKNFMGSSYTGLYLLRQKAYYKEKMPHYERQVFRHLFFAQKFIRNSDLS
jgi:hypothetical protein